MRWMSRDLGISDPVMFHVAVALAVSVVVFILITLLDRIGDGELSSDQVEKSLRQMILAMSILVGFGWEQSFDTAIGALSSVYEIGGSPRLGKAMITVVLVVVVAPAWKWYIIPKYMELQSQRDDARANAWNEFEEIAQKGLEFDKFNPIPQVSNQCKLFV